MVERAIAATRQFWGGVVPTLRGKPFITRRVLVRRDGIALYCGRTMWCVLQNKQGRNALFIGHTWGQCVAFARRRQARFGG